ncbi:MAG: DNA/RNA nuclease SfsA [Kiloniellales bacterium]|nr:DNA/RNA nuclease SfsA [Kiloniellales bacterium]
MLFDPPLISARFIRRYKRFFCEAALDNGSVVTAHCPNPGSMRTLLEPGQQIWLSPNDNPRRKLRFTWELVSCEQSLVGVNTAKANTITGEALENGMIKELGDYAEVRREVPYGRNSRIDFLLEGNTLPPCYLEIKSVTMSRKSGLAEFPDSVTARGLKHLGALIEVPKSGGRSVLLFLTQRSDVSRVGIAADIDRSYARALVAACEHGVEILCYRCKVMLEGIILDTRIPFVLPNPDAD